MIRRNEDVPAGPLARRTADSKRSPAGVGRHTGDLDQETRFLTVNTPYEQEAIGPLMTRLRKARGYSQLTVAQMLCAVSGHVTVTRHEVSRWERQERLPSEFWLTHLAEILSVPIDLLRGACAAARGVTEPCPDAGSQDRDPGAPLVRSWLVLQHGPAETVIALGGVEVDQLRTVLAPINTARETPEPEPIPPDLDPLPEHM